MTGRIPVPEIRGTTILSVRHRGRVVMAGGGQGTGGQTIMKRNAREVRRLYQNRVLAGFAGALAAARALVKHADLDARTIAEEAMRVAAEICVYTNQEITVEELAGE